MDAFSNLVEIQKLKKEKLKQIVVTLPSSGWAGSAVPYTQTISVNGVTATNIVIVSPQPTQSNITTVTECKVVASEQGVDALTFMAMEEKPASNVVFNILTGGE